jgi:microcystin-dependent protein
MVETTWGTVASVSSDGKTAGAYLYGETDGAYISNGFRVPETSYVTIGDSVKVAIDYGTGDRWIEEINVSSAYKKVAINPSTGEILQGDGTAAPEPFVGGGGSGRNLLPNGGFLHIKNGWSLYQNGDTTATWSLYTNSDATWVLRDGETKAFDGVGGPYGETAYIYSTATGTFSPYIASDRLPCIAGESYSLRVPVGTHRVTGTYASIWFYDNTGAFISGASSQTLANDVSMSGGPTLANWRFLTIDGTVAPAGAQTMVVAIVMNTPYISGSDCYLFIDQVMLTKSEKSMDYQPFVEPGVPAGAMMMWPTNTAPAGYLICNGSAVSRTTYSDLFNAIGTTYGAGDGSTTFGLPNMVNRVPYGRNAEAIGSTGGATTHTHAGHSAHVFTQPSSHTIDAHTGGAVSAHSGTAVATHTAHKHEAPLSQNSGGLFWRSTPPFGTGGAHTPANYANTGTPSGSDNYSLTNTEETALSHSVTQPAAHTFTQPSNHAALSHSGGAVDGHSAHDSPSNMMPYIILNYIIKI